MSRDPQGAKMKAADIPEREMLEAFHEWQTTWREPAHKRFLGRFPEKVIYAKMAKLDRRGLIEYGVSLRTGWLTSKGLARLYELRVASTGEKS